MAIDLSPLWANLHVVDFAGPVLSLAAVFASIYVCRMAVDKALYLLKEKRYFESGGASYRGRRQRLTRSGTVPIVVGRRRRRY